MCLFQSNRWFITHAIKPEAIFCCCCFITLVRAQKHHANDTNTHVTHCGTNFPALQNWMRWNVAKSGPALVTNEISAHRRVCRWCVKPRWQSRQRFSAPARNLQLLRSGNSCWPGYRILWGIIPLAYRPRSAILWEFICLHGALNRRGWWEYVTLWFNQRRLDLKVCFDKKLDYVDFCLYMKVEILCGKFGDQRILSCLLVFCDKAV